MKRILSVVFTLSAAWLTAQDFSIFHRYESDRLVFDGVPAEMSFNEYQLLSRDIRMIDIGYAMVVPGFTHFKAQEPVYAWSILGVDAVAATVLAVQLNTLQQAGLTYAEAQALNGYQRERQLIGASATVIFTAFLFDHIHGKWRLERKQEAIRYKYQPKIRMAPAVSSVDRLPVVGLQMAF